MPEISIIMGVYNANRNHMIETSINSIIHQTFTDWELILCDDGSDDGTFDELKRYTEQDKRIRLLHNEQNMGLGYSLNRCLAVCIGNFIARMDIDDYCVPERLAIQKSELEKNVKYCFCSSNVFLFDEKGRWGKKFMKEWVTREDFLFTSPFIHPALLARRELFDTIKYSVKRMSRRAEDYELFMNAYALGYEGFNIQKALYGMREDAECYSRRKYRERWFEVYIRLQGFWKLGLLPKGILFVIKPLAVGLVPQKLLNKLRKNVVKIKGKRK